MTHRHIYVLVRIIIIAAAIMLAMCSSPRHSAVAASSPIPAVPVPVENPATQQDRLIGGNVTDRPNVIIYRTSGDFTDKVPVDLNGDRTYLVSYPAPTDITESSRPLPLAGGYLLDRRGIRPTSAFLTYTYADYAAMKEAPAPSAILSHVIPGSHVTRIVEMPFAPSADLAADTAECNRLIREGLPGCQVIYPAGR